MKILRTAPSLKTRRHEGLVAKEAKKCEEEEDVRDEEEEERENARFLACSKSPNYADLLPEVFIYKLVLFMILGDILALSF